MAFIPLLLIVEDNEFTRKMLTTALSGKHYLFAKNGKEAIDTVVAASPHIVFLDIMLPDMTGFEVLEKIKEKKSDVYVVMLSAHSDKNTILKSIKAGASGFITKPFSKSKIEDYIRKYVEERQKK